MKNSFKRIRAVVGVGKVKELIALKDKYGLLPITIGFNGQYASYTDYFELSKKHKSLTGQMLFRLRESALEITTNWFEGKPTTYVFDLNLEEDSALTGHMCYAEFNKYYKVPDAFTYKIHKLNTLYDGEQGKFICSASPTIGFNPALNNAKYSDVYEYDLNSAYASVLSKKIPDLHHPTYHPLKEIVKDGEVGFLLDDKCTLVEPGHYADVIFPEIESPDGLKKYCKLYYEQKRNGNKKEKLDAKAKLVYPIGYMQRKNPFLRAYIVHKCNKAIEEIIDDNTICWNTDAIYSRVKRTDLLIGSNIGEFKEIRIKTFKVRDNNYQIDDDIPVYRGVVKEYYRRFKKRTGKAFDILTDTLLPEDRKCIYSFNMETLELEKNDE